MRTFKRYNQTEFENTFLSDNRVVFGTANNDFQKGFGHGEVYGTSYCNDSGGGTGYGSSKGDGYGVYPYQLIQFWK